MPPSRWVAGSDLSTARGCPNRISEPADVTRKALFRVRDTVLPSIILERAGEAPSEIPAEAY